MPFIPTALVALAVLTQTASGDALPGARVAGRILLGGTPLQAQLTLRNHEGNVILSLGSGPDGHFEGHLPSRLPRLGPWIAVVKSKEPPVHRWMRRVEATPDPATGQGWLEIVLPDSAMTGRVLKTSGEAVAKAIVNIAAYGPSGAEGSVQVRTDADGRFTVHGLALRPHRVDAHAPDGVESRPVDVDLSSGRGDVTLTLDGGLQIPARVVFADTGQPIAGAMVKVDSAQMRRGAMGGDVEKSDAEGRVALRFPPGTRIAELLVGAPGHTVRMMSVPVVPDAPITLAMERAGGTLVLDLPERTPGELVVLLHQGSREIAGYLSALWDPHGTGRTQPGRLTIAGLSAGRYSACAMDIGDYQGSAVLVGDRCAHGILEVGSELVLQVPSRVPARP